MSKDFTHGTKVEWDWGNGTGEGKKQDDGDMVLKSGGELRKASG